MALLIDSESFDFNNMDVRSVSTILENFLECLSFVVDRGEGFLFCNSLQSKKVYEEMDLWTFLYSDLMQGLNREVIDEIASYFNTGTYYEDDSTLWPPSFMDDVVNDEQGIETCLNYSFVHHNNINRIPFACLSLSPKSKIKLVCSHGNSTLYFINSHIESIDYWRNEALDVLRDNQHSLEIIAPHAYPDLYFKDGVWGEVNNFSGGYAAVYNILKKYLSILNDHGAWVFITPPPQTHPTDTATPALGVFPSKELIENRFTSLSLNMAPEKSNVHANLNCRTAREIVIKKRTIYCEWHGKFELHKNRIHIYPPIMESDEKLIIAFFADHLPLP